MKRSLLLGAAALVLAGCAREGRRAADTAAAFTPLGIGAAVPTYSAVTLTGDSVRVGGAEPATVLNVWATWCTSCQEEMAALDSLRARYAARGLRVVAVSVDNGDIEKVRRFAAVNKLGMTVAHDPMSTINSVYEVVGVPTTFVIDRRGNLAWRHTGNIGDVLPDARAAIEKALAP